MKKIILGVALTMQLFAAEPISFGTSHDDIKFNTPTLLINPILFLLKSKPFASRGVFSNKM